MTSPATATESLPFVAPRAAAARPALARSRIEVIDVMRGLVMVIMLLDHVRETFYLHKQVSDPMDVATTEPSLFFSRLAAHFCAPMFFYLFHLYVLLAIQILLVAVVGPNHGERFGLDVFWPVWLISLALIPVLYFPCRAFARFKRTTDKAWARYF